MGVFAATVAALADFGRGCAELGHRIQFVRFSAVQFHQAQADGSASLTSCACAIGRSLFRPPGRALGLVAHRVGGPRGQSEKRRQDLIANRDPNVHAGKGGPLGVFTRRVDSGSSQDHVHSAPI